MNMKPAFDPNASFEPVDEKPAFDPSAPFEPANEPAMSPGMKERGNIDLNNRPVVKNQDGSISTVRSLGVNVDNEEVLIPTVSPDGRIMSNDEAISHYRKTKQHLGKFDSPQSSESYAQQLHLDQEQQYAKPAFDPQKPFTSAPAAPLVPLPRPRPAEANAANAPDGSAFSEEDLNSEDIRNAIRRGSRGLAQSYHALKLGASARPLNNLSSIEERLNAGENVDAIKDEEDLFGARYMSSDERARLRNELEGKIKESAKGIAEQQAGIDALPEPNPIVKKVMGAGSFSEGLSELKKAPMTFIANTAAESAPAMVPMAAAGIATGGIGGMAAGAAATGATSYATDYASTILDAMKDMGVDIKDPAEVEAAVGNPEFMKKIGEKAHAHAVSVGLLDAASARVAGVPLLPRALRPSGKVMEKVAEFPLEAPVQGTLGAAGEAGGEVLQDEPINPGQIIGEFFGEFAETPGKMAQAVVSERGTHTVVPATAAAPGAAPVATAADVAAEVGKGTVAVDSGPPAPVVVPGTPVTTQEGGVNTTTTVHGPADAYTVETGMDGQPTLKAVPEEPEKIVTAAIQHGGQIYTGAVHSDAIENAAKTLGVDPDAIMAAGSEWDLGGFATNRGRYVSREEAQQIAEANDQIDKTALGYAPGKKLAAETVKTEESPDFYTRAYEQIAKTNAANRGVSAIEELAAAESAPLVEVTRAPMTEGEKNRRETELAMQMEEIVASDPMASLADGSPNFDHPALSSLVAEMDGLDNDQNWTKYEANTVPGPREAYTELTMHLLTSAAGAPVTVRVTQRTTNDGKLMAVAEGPHSEVPGVATRFLSWAANAGISHVAWATPPQGPHGREIARWAKTLGGTMGLTTVPGAQYSVVPGQPVFDPLVESMEPQWNVVSPTGQVVMTTSDPTDAHEYAQRNSTVGQLAYSMTLPESAITTIQLGLPREAVHEESIGSANISPASPASTLSKEMVAPLVDALNDLIKKFKIGLPVTIVVHDGDIQYWEKDPENPSGPKKLVVKRYTLGLARSNNKRYEIHVSLQQHKSALGVWATLAHELGHIVMYNIYEYASPTVRTAVDAAYAAFKAQMTPTTTMQQLLTMQSNTVSNAEWLMAGYNNQKALSELSAKDHDYWTGFNEWFAEQVAKWATTRAKPLSLVDKFFKGMADRLNTLKDAVNKVFKTTNFEVVPELGDWLDSFIKDEGMAMMGPTISTQTQQETIVKNATQMASGDTPTPQQPETGSAGGGIGTLFNGRPPKEVQQARAYADKFNWLWKVFTGIHQFALANKHIQSLQDYVETISIAQLTKQNIMIRAQEVLTMWNKLGELQADAVSALLDDVQNMTYRTPDEIKRKVSRHPTQAELLTLAQKHGVSAAGLAVFGQVTASFQEHLARLEAILRKEAAKISDPTLAALKQLAITKQMTNYKSKPYFPAMRFGNYTVTIRNAKGSVIYFGTYETKGIRDRAMRVLEGQMAIDDKAQAGFINKEARPLLGVPTALLDLMSEKLQLSPVQHAALEQLKFELSPAESFAHRFQHKKRIAGYSEDFRRAYAKYFFHGANHLMKAQYADRLRGLIKMTKDEVKDASDVTKRDQIVAKMTQHNENWLDPKPDWAAIRSVAFLWGLAFSPAAATQNLTQTLITTHPFLGAKFGKIAATRALFKAGTSLENFYKKRTLQAPTNFAQKAIFQGMQEGVIKETQAPELAGYADGTVLGKGFGGNKLQRAMVKFNEWGSFMFEMTEQYNRRIAFRAALELAMANPNSAYVREVVARRKQTYDQRRAEGWTEAEASAYVAAIDAVKATQFEYGKDFAPPVLSGRPRSFLVFKTFQQSYIMFLINNRDARIHALIVGALLGGLMGAPGAEDLKEILRMLAWQLFGTDFKLDHEARKWVMELLGEKNGDWASDLMLHGSAQKGYGIPALMDMLAGTVGVNSPMPSFDRSKAISSGSILPVELGKIFGPPLQTPEKVISEQTQKAAGAVFGVGFAAYRALRSTQNDWNDFKMWESMMPRALASVSKAYRAGTEGGARTSTGSQVVKYDVRDPQQAAEVIGMGMGYTPTRQNYEWEKIMAGQDAVKMIDIRRTQLMGQFDNAALGKTPSEKTKVIESIREFNHNLQPEERGKAITNDALKKSVQTKVEGRVMQEHGLSAHKSDIPILRREQKLYPNSQRELRKVKSSLTP